MKFQEHKGDIKKVYEKIRMVEGVTEYKEEVIEDTMAEIEEIMGKSKRVEEMKARIEGLKSIYEQKIIEIERSFIRLTPDQGIVI